MRAGSSVMGIVVDRLYVRDEERFRWMIDMLLKPMLPFLLIELRDESRARRS